MTAEERRRKLPGAIVKWYGISQESRVACVVCGHGNSRLAAEALEEDGLCVEHLSLEDLDSGEVDAVLKNGTQDWEEENATEIPEKTGNQVEGIGTARETYDIIIAVDIIEHAQNPATVLYRIHGLLSSRGKFLLSSDNRLGIRYFCGDQDVFSGKVYDSIEDYRHLLPWERKGMEGRAYAKAELIELLEKAGFSRHRFFSVFPRTANPQLLLAEDYVPSEALDIRVFPEYNNPGTVFLCEEELYPSLIANGLLHGMANGFLVECPLDGSDFSPVNQVTLSGERGPENAMSTILCSDGTVEKRALYQEGRGKTLKLYDNNSYLSAHGVRMIEAELKGNAFVMPYVKGIPANDYFRDVLKRDKGEFIRQLDLFWNIILHSSEHADADRIDWERFEPGWEKRKADDPCREKWKKIAHGTPEEREELGVILERGYLDLVSLNCFFLDGRFVFYDQELFLENVPAKAILLRTIEFVYKFNDQLDSILPRRELFERYGLMKHMDLYQKFINCFLNILRDDDGLSDYYKEGRREMGAIRENRKRMDYSEEEYHMIFRDIFHHTRGRRLYLFGSGKYAKRFLKKFGDAYPVSGYLDNNESLWGTEIDGLPVFGLTVLKKMNPAEYKVIVCIRDYMPVVKQLHRMQIPNFSVYEPERIYQNPTLTGEDWTEDLIGRAPTEAAVSLVSRGKKYNVGYVAGVFDLFHIGHLNLLRRAKEQCRYLIVGVVTDEGVIRHKKSNPKIPFDERIAIVRACRYVDEAVEIPLDQGDTDEAYRRYHFDAQFSGSDYADDPKWMAKRDFLQRHGSDLVFFPYTEGISTTELKEIIKE